MGGGGGGADELNITGLETVIMHISSHWNYIHVIVLIIISVIIWVMPLAQQDLNTASLS